MNDVLLLIGGRPLVEMPAAEEADGEESGMPGVCLHNVGLGLGGRGSRKEPLANSGGLWVTERGDVKPWLLPGVTPDDRHVAGRTAEIGRELEPDSRLGTGTPPEFAEGLPVGKLEEGGMPGNGPDESG